MSVDCVYPQILCALALQAVHNRRHLCMAVGDQGRSKAVNWISSRGIMSSMFSRLSGPISQDTYEINLVLRSK